MILEPEKLKEVLLHGAYVSPEDFLHAEEYCKIHHNDITEYLLEEKLLTPDLLGQAIAEFFHVIYFDLNTNIPSRELVLKIPEEVAKEFHVVAVEETKKTVIVATDNPEQKKEIQTKLKAIFPKQNIEFVFSMDDDVARILLFYRKALDTRFAKIIEEQKRIAPEIIDEILGDAVGFHASDIHFDPHESEVVVRFRIDGLLQEAGRIPKIYYENVVNRIKVQGHLRTDEHFTPQDGAMRYVKFGATLDIRISVVPTLDGEKIVMRLLSEYVRGLTFSDVGMSKSDEELLLQTTKKPFGMILVTGPTGSGKTTTLYTLLKILNTSEVNIATIEDPVEYKITGVNHIQVNAETNITFATGLRSIVRQDPNIILVGEIRDKDTSEIAVNAALTGHLLLSTFHANDAATVVPRLLDMGIEPFLLSSTLELIIAQRLVRRICAKCRYSYTEKVSNIEKEIGKTKAFSGTSVSLYKGKGCESCNHSGFKGRIAVFELIRLSDEIRDLILLRPSSKQIWQVAQKQGAHSLFEDGLEKVKNGVTTLDELIRVAAPTK